jgi:hypothetical protein
LLDLLLHSLLFKRTCQGRATVRNRYLFNWRPSIYSISNAAFALTRPVQWLFIVWALACVAFLIRSTWVGEKVFDELVDVYLIVAFEHSFIHEHKTELITRKGKSIVDFGVKKVLNCHVVGAREVICCKCLVCLLVGAGNLAD